MNEAIIDRLCTPHEAFRCNQQKTSSYLSSFYRSKNKKKQEAIFIFSFSKYYGGGRPGRGPFSFFKKEIFLIFFSYSRNHPPSPTNFFTGYGSEGRHDPGGSFPQMTDPRLPPPKFFLLRAFHHYFYFLQEFVKQRQTLIPPRSIACHHQPQPQITSPKKQAQRYALKEQRQQANKKSLSIDNKNNNMSGEEDNYFLEPEPPKLQAIIYAEFDNDIGRVIRYQVRNRSFKKKKHFELIILITLFLIAFSKQKIIGTGGIF